MPMIHSIVPESDSHVYMPVLKQLAGHLVKAVNVERYIKDAVYIDTGWTSPKGTRKNHTFFTRTNTLRLVADQQPYNSPVFEYQSFQFTPGHGFNPNTTLTHLNPVIEDNTAGIYLYESVLPASFTIQATWWFNSRNVAYETLKKMIYRYAPGVISTMSLTYDYPMPKDIVSVIYNLYKYRKFDDYDTQYKDILAELKSQGKDTLSFIDWLKGSACTHFSAAKHRVRDDLELCVGKTIDNALIEIACDVGKPEEIKVNNVPEVYTIPFTVKIQFEEASVMVMKYPCIVDATPLPAVFIPNYRGNDTTIASQWPRMSNPLWDGGYRYYSTIKQYPTGAVKIPYYDDWKVPWNHLFSRSYRPFFISLFTADENTPFLKLDLKNYLYEDYRLNEIVIEVLKAQLHESFRADCIFNIAAYCRDNLQAMSDMSLNDDLILTIRASDIHPQRHLVISQITNTAFLNEKWYWVIEKYPDLFPPITNPDYWEDVNEGGHGSDQTGIPKDYYGINRSFTIFNTALRPVKPTR